jgi:hypothetical protein
MEKIPCGGCGSTRYYTWQKIGDTEACNECAVIVDTTPRDAFGTKIRLSTENMGAYAPAIDGPVHSARHLSELCRKNNWVLAKQ